MNEAPFIRSSTVSPVAADVFVKSIETETPEDFSEALIIPSDAAATLTAFAGLPGAVLSTLNVVELCCVAAFPAASLTLALKVYVLLSLKACKSAAETVIEVVLLETVPV